jgi:hypothetical protein
MGAFERATRIAGIENSHKTTQKMPNIYQISVHRYIYKNFALNNAVINPLKTKRICVI